MQIGVIHKYDNVDVDVDYCALVGIICKPTSRNVAQTLVS